MHNDISQSVHKKRCDSVDNSIEFAIMLVNLTICGGRRWINGTSGYAVQSLNRCIGQALNNIPAMRENENLTGIQVWILNFLFRRGERETFQRDVEAEFHVRRSTATELLKQMERGRAHPPRARRLRRPPEKDRADRLRRRGQKAARRADPPHRRPAHGGLHGRSARLFFRFVERFESNLAKLS